MNRPQGCSANHFFVMKQAHHFVQCAGKHGFGNIEQAARSQDPVDLGQCLLHLVQRDMVQGFQHQRELKALRRKGNCLRTSLNEVQTIGTVEQVLGMLEFVNFQSGDFAVRKTGKQFARQFGAAAPEFEDALVLFQIDEGLKQVNFVGYQGCKKWFDKFEQ